MNDERRDGRDPSAVGTTDDSAPPAGQGSEPAAEIRDDARLGGAEQDRAQVDAVPYDPPITARSITLSVTTVLLALLLAAASVVPLPYAVSGPGPTRDTLGEQDGTPLISISGAQTYPSTGELLLTTVSTAGGPGYPVTLGDVLRGWVSGARSVRPVEDVFPVDESAEDIEEANQADMVSSQENATVSALEELGYEVPTTLTVESTMEGSGAQGVVESGDVVTSLDGLALTSFADLSAAMDVVSPGQSVTLGVTRDGEPYELEVTTTDDGTGRAVLG
ncbi:PDZ domain-containing protein, partial [Actinotalea sp.]|uniref:PDZ domain-containing protein n=1 Tax=Actinotalea sp. TaxID=1872145 RepID=UPI00356915E7